MQPTGPVSRFSDTVAGEMTGATLVVMLDNPPVNACSADMRQGLLAAIRYVLLTDHIQSVIISGAGRTFVGGADIREFGQLPQEPSLRLVTQEIENCSKPVIAAINGAALGGGAEIALACHYRLALPDAKIGLPEVKLGIVPGAGGTQRLPLLTGKVAAIELIGTGKIIDSAKALRFGIIDQVVATDLVAAALDIATANSSAFRKTASLAVPVEADADIDAAAEKVLARSKGLPAPFEAVRLIRNAGKGPFANGLADEKATFLALRDSEVAAALRHVFFAERAAAKVDGLQDTRPLQIKTVGIIGLGLMGAGIAVAVLDAGYSVIGVEQTEPAAAEGKARIETLLARNLASGRIDSAGFEDGKSRLSIAHDLAALGDVDLVIEAVFDDLDVKTRLFKDLDPILRPDAVLATNTSYLNPDTLAAATNRPENIIGLHFFSPANVMRLVEVVRCAMTSPEVLLTGIEFARKLGKLPVVARVTVGFIGNRIFSAYRREAEFLLEDGAWPQEIDAAMQSYGFAMGPFAVFDMAGLQIAWARRKREAAGRDPGQRYVDIADRLCEAGRFGRKTGRGWYLYDNGNKQVDPEVTAMIHASRQQKGIKPRQITESEIIDRLIEAMASEGRKLLDEHIAARASDIDLVMINGYGFPAHKGGPIYAVEHASRHRD